MTTAPLDNLEEVRSYVPFLRPVPLLPGLNVALLERCATIPSWLEARRTFRAGLAAGQLDGQRGSFA